MAIVESAEAGLRAAAQGATMIQLRAPDKTARDVEREAVRLKAESKLPVIVSARCDIALAAGLDGVNLPENDISVADARRLLGSRWISRSVHSPDAEAAGAGYVIFGPVWPTASHPGRPAHGLEALKGIVRRSDIPVIAIGGVTAKRVAEVLEAGAAGYASITMFR
ncbi:MAG TPA: thiamine phosphate synthase [Candidatus Dormibacteraeota bacterium]|nr:thiamine phosphate synthase [Candidatus Dormibacteraeota bacterium]